MEPQEKDTPHFIEELNQAIDWASVVEMEAEAAVSPLPPSVQCLFEADLRLNASSDMDMTNESLIQIPELKQRGQTLTKREDQLRKELAETREEKTRLIADLSSVKMEWDVSLKVQQLEEALKDETKKREKTETRLARRDEEMSNLKNALARLKTTWKSISASERT
ncbi:myosin-4-like protein [Lates japonicus]|uniref:Myosin-4-like protein n=1 Tax=Lates japonicus TaxID=270547 RepID=A0AAD3NB75_LATJO|nr:myosin-4-like protein [Lates japonicus]